MSHAMCTSCTTCTLHRARSHSMHTYTVYPSQTMHILHFMCSSHSRYASCINTPAFCLDLPHHVRLPHEYISHKGPVFLTVYTRHAVSASQTSRVLCYVPPHIPYIPHTCMCLTCCVGTSHLQNTAPTLGPHHTSASHCSCFVLGTSIPWSQCERLPPPVCLVVPSSTQKTQREHAGYGIQIFFAVTSLNFLR